MSYEVYFEFTDDEILLLNSLYDGDGVNKYTEEIERTIEASFEVLMAIANKGGVLN